MYSREEVKAITDKVMNMAKADAVEVEFNGGSKLFNVTADRTIAGGVGTVGYDDDGVKTQEWPIVRDGVLVGLQTNREMAHLIGEKESRGCTSANSWRDYPFLRMPNVHVDAGRPDRRRPSRSSPTPGTEC